MTSLINAVIALCLWSLMVVYTFRVRHRRDNSMYWAIGLIALAMTTNVGPIYSAVSPAIPIPNLLALLGNLSMLFGVYYLARAIRNGARAAGSLSSAGRRWDRWGAWIAAALMVIGFALTDAPEIATAFMLTYGDQLGAAIYSAAQFAYLGTVMATTVVTCVRNVPRMQQRRFTTGFTLIGFGCLAGFVMCLCVVVMDIFHLLGELDAMRAVSFGYDLLRAIAVVMLATGLAIPPVTRQIEQRTRSRSLKRLEPNVREIWAKTVAMDSEFSLAESLLGAVRDHSTAEELSERVHRMIVEVRDWQSVTAAGFSLGEEEIQLLDRAERLCLQKVKGAG